MALQDTVVLMAPGPPAMLIFVLKAIMVRVRYLLDQHDASIFPVIGFIAVILSVSSQLIWNSAFFFFYLLFCLCHVFSIIYFLLA